MRRPGATLLTVLLLAGAGSAEAQGIAELFGKVASTVVVVRARGGCARAGQRRRLRRRALERREDHDRGPPGARGGRHRRPISRGAHRGRPGRGFGAGRRPVSHPAGSGAGRPAAREARQLGWGAGGGAGDRRGRPLRAGTCPQRRLDQCPVGAEHGVQGDSARRVLPDRRQHQRRQFRGADVQHGGRGHRHRESRHLEERRQRGPSW